jgi:hypothetical protein
MDLKETFSENPEMAQEHSSLHDEIDEPHRANKRVKIEPVQDATNLVNDKTNTHGFGRKSCKSLTNTIFTYMRPR